MRGRHRFALAGLALTALAAAACGSKRANLPTDIGIAASAAPTQLPRIGRAPDPSPLGVDEHVLLTVADRTIGPFLARASHGDAVLAAYLGTSEAGVRRVVSVPLSPTGEPRGDAKVVASVANDATTLVLRPTGGERAGFVAAWTSLTDRGEALNVVGVGEDGRPHGTPTELARTGDHLVWVDAVPTSHGAIVVWAEETGGATANILSVSLGPDGSMRGVPARVARGVSGWQIVASGDGNGAALALVAPAAAARGAAAGAEKAKRIANLTLQRLDVAGAPAGAPVAVTSGASMSGDVDVVRTGEGYVLAWTDAADSDLHVALAAVDDAGHVKGPTHAPEGAAALVGIASGPAGAILAWEDPLRRARDARHVYAARIEAGPALDAKTVASFDVEGRGALEVVAARDGFAMLAPARTCWERDARACADAPVLPTLLRFDARMAVTQVEPLRLGSVREGATLGWGLTCGAEECLALAAGHDQPARVRTVDLRPRATAFRPPYIAEAPADAPRVEGLVTLGVGAFADLAAANVGSGSILALLGAALEEPTAKKQPGAGGATLSVQPLDARGAAVEPPVVLSKRALTIGGVAIAPGARAEDGAAIAWVAPEAGDPEVHVTRVDAHGKRLQDRLLSTAKGDASDVAIAWTGDGWVVAWVDARDGNGEVYATKVDRELRRVGKPERITNAPGDASDVAILARPDAVWLAWADPRESPADGFADVYVAQLRARDATKVDAETRVLATAAHSRSPALAATGDQVAVGWIEEAPLGADSATSQAYGAMLAWLDPHGRPVRAPGHLGGAGDGFPTAITMDGTPTALHVVLARAGHETMELDALEITHDPTHRSYALLGLEGPPSLDVAFTLLGSALYFNDEGQDPGERRARRARIAWRR